MQVPDGSLLILVALYVLCFSTCAPRNDKEFRMKRLKDMDDLMPPINPVSPIEPKELCAMMCVNDVTCAAFSYSAIIRFCMMTPEVFGTYEVSISLSLPGFVHFNVYEDIGVTYLPAGYRTFNVSNLAIRFHWYKPVTWEEASDVCAGEGGRLLTLDTEEKRVLLQDLISKNKDLSSTGDGLFVGGLHNGTDFYWRDDSVLSDTSPLWEGAGPTGSGNCTILHRNQGFKLVDTDCSTQQPYVCEHLYYESNSLVPFWGTYSL